MFEHHSQFYQGRPVLITGGLGFIGSNLAEALVEAGARVTIMDSMIPKYGGSLEHIDSFRKQITVNFSDIRDAPMLRSLVRGQEVIFNLAGQVSHIDSMTDPINDLDINCRSQLNLLECLKQVNPTARTVFTSTRQVYGRAQKLPVKETAPCCPTDVNGISKLAAEMFFQMYWEVYGIPTVSLRLTNTYGPRMDLRNSTKGFVGVFLQRAFTGMPLKVFGSGEQRRDFNYVSDVVEALLLAGSSSNVNGQIFNLGHFRHYSILEFLQFLQRHLDFSFECVPFPQERREIDIGDYWGDYSLFHALTGWQPKVDLDEGLESTLRYFKQHPNLVPGLESLSV